MSDPAKPVSADWIHAIVAYFALPEVAGIVAVVGTVAAIIGLVFTLWVLIGVRTIRSHFLFTARVPQIIIALQANAVIVSATCFL